MKNIGVLVSSLNKGGAERAAANLSKDLSRFYNVFLIVFSDKDVCYDYRGTLISLNIAYHHNLILRALNRIKMIALLTAIKRKYKLACVISFMPGANKINVVSGHYSKTIVSIRNTMSQKGLSKREKKSITKTSEKADLTVSLSDGAKEDLIDNFCVASSKVITIYNSCDINWFLRDDACCNKLIHEFDFSGKVIVTVGRLHPQKGQWHLIAAFSKVVDIMPEAKLVIFGSGELEAKLVSLCKRLGISNKVFFMGFVKNYHSFMKKCDVFVFPSIYEGLGNVLLEAIACGLPVISTDCLSGPREILSPSVHEECSRIFYGEYGILVPPFHDTSFDDDYELSKGDIILFEAINRVLADEKLSNHYKDKALERSTFFLPENIVGQWKTTIDKLIGGEKYD